MDKLSASKAQYNNCFVLGGKSKNQDGKPVKVPMCIDKHGYVEKLWGGKAGPLCGLYALTYEQARRTLNAYLKGGKRVKGDESLRVSLHLDNAMYGDLHIFVIDFDSFLDELDLLPRMNDAQKEVFEHLKDISPDCTRGAWFSVGLDIWHVFGDDLGGDVFRYWSEPGESFNPQGCAVTWGNIMERGPDSHLNNRQWDAILHENIPSAF